MEFKSNTSVLNVFLKTSLEIDNNDLLVNSVDDILNWPVCKNKKHKKIVISFENKFLDRDANYIIKKKKQFKKKKFEKIFKGAMKILKCYPNYYLAYLFAGASALKCKKYEEFAVFYLTSAALANPNCMTAWDGLQKYCRNNDINDDLFEIAFMGYLITERRIDKWKDAVKYILNSEIPFTSRNPFRIIGSLLKKNYFYDDEQKSFIANVLPDYIFSQMKHMIPLPYNSFIPDIAVSAFILYLENNTGEDLYTFHFDALIFLFHIGSVRGIYEFILRSLESDSIVKYASVEFFFIIVEFLFGSNLDPNCYLSRIMINQIAKAQVFLKRRSSLTTFLLALHYFSKGYYIKTRSYCKKRTRDLCVVWKLNLIQVMSSIRVQDFEYAWKQLLCAVSKNVITTGNTVERMYQKRARARSHLELLLYFLTHNCNKLMQKFGLILCLKLIEVDFANVRTIFYASIACISLNEDELLTACLHQLARLGAINEIIFLSALKTTSYSTKIMYLKEIQHLQSTHLYAAILSYKFENEKKALKSFCKATVMVQDSVFLYEWLGIYAYENNDLVKAKMYFEIALFYNRHSWTSINYYASILSLENPNYSKLFLSLYNNNRKSLSVQHMVDLKAGLAFFKINPSKQDYFKACEYFRFILKAHPNNRCLKEMLAESYSKFGMTGAGLKCFKESYITDNHRHLYSGSMIGKQYLFVKGVRKYLKMMKCIVNCGGMDVFIALHNTAHAFLIKSIQLSSKYYYFLSQIYCQQALFFCVRAIAIFSNYSSIWKLMGDILFQCSCLGYSAGFLYIPHWLLQDYASKKIILVRRYQSALLAIRCYYAGLNTDNCSKEMMVCLWNSISVALRKVSSLSTNDFKHKLITFGIQSSINSLQIDIKNNMSWNLLGILINDQALTVSCSENRKVAQQNSFMALDTGLNLGSPVAYSLFSMCNAGFIATSMSDFEMAHKLFLSARGTYSSLDKPWLGNILINLQIGNLSDVIENIVYLYLLTNHRPTLNTFFTSLLFLSPFLTDKLIYYMGRRYKHKSDGENLNFMNCFLSGTVNYEMKKYKTALINHIIALRTCLPFCGKYHTFVNAAVQNLVLCIRQNKLCD